MEMEIKCEKGDQVILTDNCAQSFVGFVKCLNQELGRIVLSDIVQLPDHTIITGYRHFDKNEIRELKKYEANKTEGVTIKEGEETKPKKPETALSESAIKDMQKLQSGYHYISDFDRNFHSAIDKLKTCKKIGLCGWGTSQGRCQRASLIAISMESDIFVFDLTTLADDVFKRGLKEILESPRIIKVVHDCRLLSDCLKHKHLVSLEGVRDVEAEDIMVVYQERKMIRKHRRSLEYLVKVYLGVEVDEVEDHSSIWTGPSLSSKHLNALVSHVSFLIPLQEAIQHKYLQRLINASNVYNTHIRDLDFFDYLNEEQGKTLRKQMIKLSLPQMRARADLSKSELHK